MKPRQQVCRRNSPHKEDLPRAAAAYYFTYIGFSIFGGDRPSRAGLQDAAHSFETKKRPPSSPTHSERPIHLGPQVHNTRNQATPLHTGRAQLAREFLRWLVFSLGPPARPLSLWHGWGERCFLSTFALGSPLV